MLNLSNQEQVCVDYFENHHLYVLANGLTDLTPQGQRIYLRGEEIIDELLES